VTKDRIGHQVIVASAGTGKTFQLAHRYIWLLANGVKPEQIIALTFSRKAAGEIFDSIIGYLCEAANSMEGAHRTGERIGKPKFEQADFLWLLRMLLVGLHRLHISTLDSFIIGVLRAFPMEIGVPTVFHVLDSDGAQAKSARQEILGTIFNNRYVDRSAQHQFLEAFQQANFGREEKGLERRLNMFITHYQSYYRLLPAPDDWGREDVVWPWGSPWLTAVDDVNTAADELEALLAKEGWDGDVMGRWLNFIKTVRTFSADSAWTRDVEYMFKKLLANVDDLRRGQASIRIDRTKCNISGEGCRLTLALLTHVIKTELSTELERTHGIYRILEQYERFYDYMIRRQGKLTFTDAQYLLTAANSQSGGSLLSRIADEEARLYIDYRLDCRLDHWLLDEFQDTSDLQWEVFRNLADEILQDNSGRRSFFYVGDVKQAIYGWRGGNYRLFNIILEQYGSQIEQIPLSTSFRSCQPIIDTVNRVFGDLTGAGLPAGAVAEWEKVWQVHQLEKEFVPRHGYAALLEPPCQNGEVKPTDEDRYRAVAHLLKEIDPLSRGLSVAVLVRSNDSGKEIVDFLRGECQGMNIVHEGRAAIKDNPVVSVLLSLVKFATHPGDTFAWRHLEMSPLKKCFVGAGLGRDNLPPVLLREIQTSGFQVFIRNWGARLDAAHLLDDFGRRRLGDLVDAADEFDGGGGDCNAFLRFIDNYDLHELAAGDAVRVMTIHQSKGLGFDIVILPDLQTGTMTGGSRIDFVVARAPSTSCPLWAMEMPRRIIAEGDPVLAKQVRASDETASFDALCLLYVALTRARQGLYMVTAFPGKGAAVVRPATFLKVQLAGEAKPVNGKHVTIDGEEFICLYEEGEGDWYTKVPQKERTEIVEPCQLYEGFHKQPSRRCRLVLVSPSMSAEGEVKADSLFAPDRHDILDFGTGVHELFQKISWIGEVNVEGLIWKWRQESTAAEDVKEKAIEHFRRALASAEVREVLTRPRGNVTLWREKRFEVVLGDRWITGVFDRVTIVRGPDGRSLRASIVDFKSDETAGGARLTDSAERYRSQMSLYRSALSRILQLDPSRIALRLLFTHPGKVYELG